MGKRRVRSDSAPSCSSERPCIGEFFCSSCSSLHPHVCCRGVSGRAASSSEVRAHRWPPTTFEMGHPFPSLSLPLRGDPEPDEPTESGRRQSHHGNPTNTRIYAVSTAMERFAHPCWFFLQCTPCTRVVLLMGECSPPLQFVGDAVGLPAAHLRRAVRRHRHAVRLCAHCKDWARRQC